MHEEDEYELIPLGPIRRLEKRIERVETASPSALTKDVIEIVKTNQEMVNEIVKINSELVDRVNSLAETVKSLSEKIDNFIGRLEVVGPEKSTELDLETQSSNLEERLEGLERRINRLLVAKVASIKRPPLKTIA